MHVMSFKDRSSKESVAIFIELYKNNVAVSCVGPDYLLLWALYTTSSRLVVIQFAWNKKNYLIWLNL